MPFTRVRNSKFLVAVFWQIGHTETFRPPRCGVLTDIFEGSCGGQRWSLPSSLEGNDKWSLPPTVSREYICGKQWKVQRSHTMTCNWNFRKCLTGNLNNNNNNILFNTAPYPITFVRGLTYTGLNSNQITFLFCNICMKNSGSKNI